MRNTAVGAMLASESHTHLSKRPEGGLNRQKKGKVIPFLREANTFIVMKLIPWTVDSMAVLIMLV